ncbi:MAG: VCBS repeat-containing protein [Planctomycetaceae bacterium]|nr:VCBS repeat-containing protein [Planctomycetaceae bacterium]
MPLFLSVRRIPSTLTVLLIVVSMFPSLMPPPVAADDDIDLSTFFGFGPVEIFKLEWRSHSLLPGDFNHDGRTDLAIVDNSHSRIDLLLQRQGPPDETESVKRKKVNEISSHWRFEHVKLPVDRNISAMAVGDFNSDGRADLAYFGDPDRLVLLFQPESGEWTEKRQVRLADVEGQSWGIAAGDLNGDGRDDVAILGKRVTYLVYQTSPGEFSAPTEIRNTADRLSLAMIGDLDGDERKDLFYLASDGDDRRASVRLQTEAGRLGPEIRFDFKNTRGLILSDLVPGAGGEVVTIDGTTGRVRVGQFSLEGRPEDQLAARLVQYGFGEPGVAKGRDLAMGDVNGDGLLDVIVTDPNAAQLIVFLQHKNHGLDLGTAFPSFLEVEQVRIADVDGDGRAEVFALSNKEKSIGVCRYEQERLSFPTTLPITGEPVAFELIDLDKDGVLELLYLEKSKRNSYVLHRMTRAGEGDWKSTPVGQDGGKLELSNEPVYMRSIDANQDGRSDLLLISAVGKPPTLLVTDAGGVPRHVETAGGLQLGNVERGAVFSGMLSEPVTLVAQQNFARSVRLDEENRWQVLDQFNPSESGAKIAGAATLDLDGEPGNELVLIDTGAKKLRIFRKEEQLYQPWEQVELGTFPYIAAHVGDLNSDGRDDLLLFGQQRFLVLYAGERPPQLKDVLTYESKLDDSTFADLVAGDLNGDGQIDVALLDIAEHQVEIITLRNDALVHALNFKVFEEKNFGRRGGSGVQPREGVIADVTGDGRDDLILLVHDRILVYPQDDGKSPEPTDVPAEPAAQQTSVEQP